MMSSSLFVSPVDEMIAEVDIDGDGRIDFEGKRRAMGKFDFTKAMWLFQVQ